MYQIIVITIIVTALTPCFGENYFNYPYTWGCVEGKCLKQLYTNKDTIVQQSLNVCMLRCANYAGVWPRPEQITTHDEMISISSNNIVIISGSIGAKTLTDKTSKMVEEISTRFTSLMSNMDTKSGETKTFQRSLAISLLMENPDMVTLANHIDESYNLTVQQTSYGEVSATITAPNYFGIRHGLETLSQLIVYDFVSEGLVVPREVEVYDRPAYTYRGILLDTARNYVSMATIHRLIDAMGINKLNTFHWHITDSHSFPFQSRTFPQMAQYGAYSPDKIYTEQDITNLVEYARVRGVRVVPELDTPGHVGEGWQWADEDNVTVCFKKEPWLQYCAESPCGQINPVSDRAYEILHGIYSDMNRLFDSDLFHMGGDEVNFNCWNSTDLITDWMDQNNIETDEEGFHQVWNRFQSKALETLDSVSNQAHPIVLWTSSLMEKGRLDRFLDKSRYIVQIWTTGKELMAELVNKGFQVIFSNYDALYFDCGFGAWVGEGNNWCSPYIPWQKVYQNKPVEMLQQAGVDTTTGEVKKLVLGQEAALWTEQADDQVIDQRLWPRAAAMAERLWADPDDTWKDVEHRFLYHRERLVARGIPADVVEPLWCLQNQGHCYL